MEILWLFILAFYSYEFDSLHILHKRYDACCDEVVGWQEARCDVASSYVEEKECESVTPFKDADGDIDTMYLSK